MIRVNEFQKRPAKSLTSSGMEVKEKCIQTVYTGTAALHTGKCVINL